MLWDLIRDFFVQHVFGGTLSNGDTILAWLGSISVYENGEYIDGGLYSLMEYDYFQFGQTESMKYYINFSDWLSTTATAISITIIVVLCCLFVYKIIRLIGGLIR